MTRQRLPLKVTFLSVCGASIDYEGWTDAVIQCRACKVWYKITDNGAVPNYDISKEEARETVTIPIYTKLGGIPQFKNPKGSE